MAIVGRTAIRTGLGLRRSDAPERLKIGKRIVATMHRDQQFPLALGAALRNDAAHGVALRASGFRILVRKFVIDHLLFHFKSGRASLFRRAEGYLGTELLRSSDDANVFVTVDRWESAACFEIFQERFGAEYKKLDALFEHYTSSEKKIGIFSEV